MDADARLRYHLGELELTGDLASTVRATPEFSDTDQAILDIGCGIGQMFVASRLGAARVLVGLDVDYESLAYGHRRFPFINFVNAAAEHLPFRDNAFDLVVARVSLPYSHIPKALKEVGRVLKDDGRVWLVWHPFKMALGDLGDSLRKLAFRGIVLRLYVLANGLFFNLFGGQFAFPFHHRYESFQTASGIRRAMKKAGFAEVVVEQGKHMIVTARKVAITAVTNAGPV